MTVYSGLISNDVKEMEKNKTKNAGLSSNAVNEKHLLHSLYEFRIVGTISKKVTRSMVYS